MISLIEKIIENLNLSMFNREKSPASKIKQKNLNGDNVGRDKNIHIYQDTEHHELYPEISFGIVGPFENGGAGLEIYNSGTEDVKNIDVTLKWYKIDESKREFVIEPREVSRFFNENENPVFASSSPKPSILRKQEKKVATGIPNIAVDKRVDVRVKCTGLRSGKLFDREESLRTLRDYRKTEAYENVSEMQRRLMDENVRNQWKNSNK